MIARNMKAYNYFTYGAPSSYGQPQLSQEAQGTVNMCIHTTSQAIQDNINYKDSAYIGLTNDKAINDKYVIEYNNEKLKVLYVTPEGRFKQVFLQRL